MKKDNQVSLIEKAEIINKFVEKHLYAPNGLFYSFLDIDTLKPISPELAKFYPVKDFPGKPDNSIWLENENSGMAAGAYLSALCDRAHLEYNPAVEAMISKVFDSIEKNYQLCAGNDEGFFCKPWGGKASDEISIDQCCAVVTGLRDLFLLKNHKYSSKAGKLAVSICDWWVRNDYTIEYWGKKGKVIENLPWSFSCLALVRIAYEISEKEIYAKEAKRIIGEYNCENVHPRSLSIIRDYFPGKPYLGIRKLSAFHHTIIDNLGVLCESLPSKKDKWNELLKDFWGKDINMGIDSDGLAYACYKFDERDNSWETIEPGFIYPPAVPEEECRPRHHYWFGAMKSGVISCMTASSAATIGKYVGDLREECGKVALNILKGVEIKDMTMIIDKDGGGECTEFGGVRKKMLDCRCFGHWLRAYWTGRKLGWF